MIKATTAAVGALGGMFGGDRWTASSDAPTDPEGADEARVDPGSRIAAGVDTQAAARIATTNVAKATEEIVRMSEALPWDDCAG
ncbi:MAG TPA: hypothetical protein VFP66_03590 [Candidatus Limnocylindrales bacterium]|nr:hypothetical protein [Candidatus Limnocylindrales bacterium]